MRLGAVYAHLLIYPKILLWQMMPTKLLMAATPFSQCSLAKMPHEVKTYDITACYL